METGEEKSVDTEQLESLKNVTDVDDDTEVEETLVMVVPRHLHNREECKKAKELELRNWDDFNVYEEVPDSGQKTLGTHWVLTKKVVDNKEGIEARLTVRGD